MLNKKIIVQRGDSISITLVVEDDHAEGSLSFVVKESLDVTGDRLVQKNGTQITTEYNFLAGKAIVTIPIDPSDTADLIAKTYYWDIFNETTNKTIAGGDFVLVADVQTPFDGFALPESAVRFQQVDAANGAVNDIAIIKEVGGVKYYEFISPADYAAILKPILDNL